MLLRGNALSVTATRLCVDSRAPMFSRLPHLLLWTVMLQHMPAVLLGVLRVTLWRGPAASPAQHALAGLMLVALVPLW